MNYFNKEKRSNNNDNFILMGPDFEELKKKADAIVAEAVELFPEKFMGKISAFPFELRYTPPYEKPFLEIKRLQGTAAQKAGWRKEFKGYIIIDVSPFMAHESEDYFDITLKFLYDSNEAQSYIFTVDNSNPKQAMNMVRKILSIIRCRVLEEKGVIAEKKKLQALLNEANIQCTKVCADMLLEARLPQDVLRNTVLDIAEAKEKLDVADVYEYLCDESSTVKYMLTEDKLKELVLLCQRTKEGDRNNEKI